MGLTKLFIICLVVAAADWSSGQDAPPSPPSSSSSSQDSATAKNMSTGNDVNKSGDQPNQSPDGGPPQEPPVWLKCVSEVTPEDPGNSDIAQVLSVWCQHYEKIIDCLSRDIDTSASDNPLDFFISLNFEEGTLLSKSKAVCSKLQGIKYRLGEVKLESRGTVGTSTGYRHHILVSESQGEEKKDKLSCTSSTNETLAGECAGAFSGGLVHVFTLHKQRDLPKEVLRGIACDVTLQTTFCLRGTLPDCEEDVQTTLLNYYSLFTNGSCVAQEGQKRRPTPPETIVSKCAREAAQTLTPEQAEPEPTSLMDFLILGLKTDCKTYSARYACYQRELDNITNFRDFWLSLTFDHDNAVASQKAYCDQIETHVIPKITDKCFNQSQPGLAACEAGFGREVEAIREEWFNNSEFDGLQLQTLACRTSVTRAACLDNAMQPCGAEVARAMAVSEMGILPDICRRLLTPKEETKASGSPGEIGSNTKSDESSRPTAGNEPNRDGNFRPGPQPSYSTESDRPLSDEAPKGNEHGREAGQGTPEPSPYNTKEKTDSMSKPKKSVSESSKMSDKSHDTKQDNNVSASKGQTDQDNGSENVRAHVFVIAFHVISLIWFLHC